MLQGQSGGEADAQSLEFLTYYLPLLDKGRRRHYANVIRGFSGKRIAAETVDGKTDPLLSTDHVGAYPCYATPVAAPIRTRCRHFQHQFLKCRPGRVGAAAMTPGQAIRKARQCQETRRSKPPRRLYSQRRALHF